MKFIHSDITLSPAAGRMIQLFDDAAHEFYSQLIRLVFILCAVDGL